MQRKLILVMMIFMMVSASLVMAQDTPERVREAAINALNQAIPGIGRPDSWRHVGPQSSTQSSLDCPGTPGVALQSPLSYYQVWLTYGADEYLIHVSADANSFVYCDPKIPGSASYQGADGSVQPTQSPAVNLTPTTSCALSTSNANVRVSPSTSAAVATVITEASSVPVVGRTPQSTWWQIGEGWIANTVVTVSGDCDAVPVTGTEEVDYGNCPIGFSGYMTSRLAVGAQCRVEDEEGSAPNRVRQNPTVTAEQLFQLQPGDEFSVINGPQCGNGYVWWQIESTDGRIGWTAESSVGDQEYYLEPVIEGLNAEGEVDFADIQFTYSTDLASDVAFEESEPVESTDEDGPIPAGHPGYREFTFLDFVEENSFDPPAARIRIYPTEAMFEYNELIYDQWVALSEVLQDQTAFAPDTVLQPASSVDIEPLPALPLRNAAQVFATQIRFVEFENGVGIRYITRYAQAPVGTSNEELFYTFQGLTYDNQYYIVADFPISAAILPDTWTPDEPFDVEALIEEEEAIYQELAVLNLADFTPDLELLDEIIASLNVE